MLSPDLLRAATGCSSADAARFAAPLSDACAFYGINTPARLAAFFAQIGHESGGLRFVRELWGPTPVQERYEGRRDLGNTQPGDGSRYRGRGLIQTTGRYNYQRVRDRLRESFGDADVPDFEVEPEALEQPRWAALSAADYWDDRGLNAPADAGDFMLITKRINGGTNGLPDRLERWARAKEALAGWSPPVVVGEVPDMAPDGPAEIPAAAPPPAAPAPTYTIPAGEAGDWQPPEASMPIPAIVGALLPSLIESIPRLGKLFGSGSAVAERNVQAATIAMQIAQEAVGARNAQEAVETIKADPAAAATAARAIEARWVELSEAGGDGISGARKADAEARGKGDMLHSPSFWVTMALLPLVYLVVGSVVGLWGTEWPSDVRAAIATAVVSLIVGGAAGYYWGQTTSRNRTPQS